MFVVRDWTRNPSYTMVSNDVKDVRDIVIGITGDETIGDHVLLHLGHMIFGQFLVWGPMRKLYVCNRKRCGDRCHYPDCRHTTDISHALNAPTFPNGFEKVKHNGNVYFVERED